MLQTSDRETEILLGNKQLLGVFFVVAVLLGVAFTGGYMVGRGSSDKKPVVATASNTPETTAATNPGSGGGATQVVTPETPEPARTAAAPTPSTDETDGASAPVDSTPKSGKKATSKPDAHDEEPPLGSPKRKELARKPEEVPADTGTSFAPQAGQTFLQVAAVGRDEAEGVAEVLQKKGFHAHAVPKPGNPKIFRVIIGPVQDAGDLSATRDSLRKKAGFREVIVQKY